MGASDLEVTVNPTSSDTTSEPVASRFDKSLLDACRAASSAAAELSGGIALVFSLRSGFRAQDGQPQLRAASGFAMIKAAKQAAQIVLPAVTDVVARRTVRRLAPMSELGDLAAGDLVIFPIAFGDRVHGALAVGAPAELDGTTLNEIGKCVSELALRIDHAHLSSLLDSLSKEKDQVGETEAEQSDEILKLSEALFAQDIELLRNSEKLGKIEKLKNDFIEKMSRELRTPLNGIIEAIISVLTGEDDALSDGAKAQLRSALDNGTAFLRTLQNILDLWRIKQGELPIEITDVNFREVVEEAVFSVQDSIGDKKLRIEQHIEEPFPKVRTDLTKVNQTLFLLLDNAVKFSHRGQIDIVAKVEDGRLYCEVRDTGIGVCQDDKRYIFDEFFQVDDSPSTGAGLGLTLVRDLLVLLGGEITFESEIGHGTRVAFDLPVQVCS